MSMPLDARQGGPSPNDPSRARPDTNHTAGIVIGVIIALIILGLAGWHLYRHLRARRLGLPPPSINPFSDHNRIGNTRSGGIAGWISEKIGAARRKRTAGGAYEGSSGAGGVPFGSGLNGRHRGAGLDPDEAWDARVGTEADGYGYEEQELSLRDIPSGYARAGGDDLETGRGRRSELDQRYEEAMMARGGKKNNPFENAEPSNMSLREVSPMRDEARHSLESTGTVRKSVFREGI